MGVQAKNNKDGGNNTLDVYELKLKVYLLKDIANKDALNQISKFIDEALSENGHFLRLHQRNCYKNYTFCSFWPLEKDGVYKSDTIYTVVLRTIDTNLAIYFEKKLKDHFNDTIKGLNCETKIIPKHLIETIYSLTPVLLKDDRGYWKRYLSISEFEERVKVNLIKKYNVFSGEKVNEDFQLYSTIRFLNRCPIKVPYKDIHLLGDKLELQVAENPQAQELIYMSLGTGLLESNARGYGFVNYNWTRRG
ncbi:CRISPR-associated endoribonuclease Cas6 [Muricomes intestini]|uniref:CRISPR-associated endoribonuclease Cas6 n=1 Tax=Muricomes intestini TaxID=1796634 RepID=A0A4R3K061_9FIRM|nr:CRISPR-associated endoribonuclease Cas6 [Muricomes intestini]